MHSRDLAGRLRGFGLVAGFVFGAGLLAGAAGAQAAPVAVTGGYADWGVRESFRNYVEGPIAQGEVSVADGATRNEDGTVRFPALSGSHDSDAAEVDVELAGSVRFTGHAGLLDTKIENPRVELAGGEGTLHADVTSKGLEDPTPVVYPDVDLAELDLTGINPEPGGEDEESWSAIPATLTENGAPAFGGFYEAGAELDPLSLTVAYGAAAIAPRIRAAKRAKLRRNRRAVIGRLVCKTGPCDVTAPKRAKARLAGKRARVKVVAPKRLGADSKRKVRVKLSRRQARRLAGSRGRVRVPLRVTSGDADVREVLRVVLKGGRS